MSLRDALREVYHFIPQSVRIGRKYHVLYKKYSELQYLPYDQRLEYQLRELQRVISYAYDHTRYYRNLFDEYGINPKQIQDFSDIKKIPILTKDMVRDHLSEMISDVIPKNRLQYVTTGGSTGKPLGLYITSEVNKKRLAFTWISWSFMGYKMGMPCAVLRGTVVRDGWFFYDRGENYLILSTYDMLEENIDAYIRKIEEFSPLFLRGYPSALEILARYMLRNKNILRKINIKTIFTSSEVLIGEQKKLIEDAFCCPISDLYGNCEQVGFIATCKHGRYHEFMEHSYLEYLNENGESVENGEFGEIVGTSFINNAVPFIRYRTGDRVLLAQEQTCSCGLHSRMIDHVEGRWHGDSIQTRYGNLISITALNTHSDIFDHTVRIQYYQDIPGQVVLKIVPRSNYTEEDSKKIYAELSEKFKDQVELRLEFVESIPLTPRGKYKYLDQRLKL
jgi:hypothetical protein CLOSPO_02323